jgi:protein SCO1/2
MTRQISTAIAVMSAALVIAVFAGSAPVLAQKPWGAQYFPNVQLTSQDGQKVRFYDLIKGKIVAIELMYTSCKYSCPLETARLAQVYRILGDRMGKDIFFYSITIDPDTDTPPVLKAYADQYQAGPGWLFLTGKSKDIETLSRKLGLYASSRTKDNPDGHMATLLIGDEGTGQWVRGSALDNPKLTATIIEGWVSGYRTGVTVKSYGEAKPLPRFGPGEYVFNTKCVVCHSLGGGDKIGPDLEGVTSRRDRQWLARYISAPEKMLEAHDPVATALFRKYKQVRMPNLGLEDKEVADLVAFLSDPAAARADGHTPGR